MDSNQVPEHQFSSSSIRALSLIKRVANLRFGVDTESNSCGCMARLSVTSSEWPPFTGCHTSSPVLHLLHTYFRIGTPHQSSRDLSLPRLSLAELGHIISSLPTQPLSTFNCDKLPIQVYHTKLTQATIDHGASQYIFSYFSETSSSPRLRDEF